MVDQSDSQAKKLTGYISLGEHISELRAKGICPTCRDIEHGDVFSGQVVVDEDDSVRIVLEMFPRAHGHTIVVWKPHHEDFTTLAPEDTAALFQHCTRVARAIKRGLGAEKVYLVTMCDGYPNHLHVQMLPRYAGEPTGSKRFVGARAPLEDGSAIAQRIRDALE